MRLEDMKNDIPETPDFIHNMIQNEVAKQLADNKVANLRRRKRWTAPKVAAVAAACALAVSTAVYAGVNLYHWFLEKQGSYGVSVKIDAIIFEIYPLVFSKCTLFTINNILILYYLSQIIFIQQDK